MGPPRRPTGSSVSKVALALAGAAFLAGAAIASDAPRASFVDPFTGRPRVVVLTDIANEPDDQMSLVRLLLYSNQLELEGLVATDLDVDEADGATRRHPHGA